MASNDPEPLALSRRYFVDEAGDPNLFNRHKRVIVGRSGCSAFFILGLVDAEQPEALGRELAELRTRMLGDPYFIRVPSMQAASRKTALEFHAKDDLPEVRRAVFDVLVRHPLRFFAVVRDKHAVVSYVRQRNERSADYRYRPNELYDYLVRRLFRDRLHQDAGYDIVFARRGRSDRTRALQEALDQARRNFESKHGILGTAPIQVRAESPYRSAGLQAADYFLWALQRLYERGEERFLRYVWPSVGLVHNIDDT
ncbi:MAG: DUF3800 domain-containing protein, partial [Planctomycetes bacterium]|nr:DUF3800 domain-containing protein [Planctomycetota bacterium]